MRRVLLLCVLLIGCSEASDPVAPVPPKEIPPESPPAVYEILVDGKPRERYSEEPYFPGEVLYVEGHSIRLGDPGPYHYRAGAEGAEDEDDLYEEQPSGEWVRVGITLRNVRVGGETLIRNPLAVMTAAEKQLLQSVVIRQPIEGLTGMLAGIDPERCLIQINLGRGDKWECFPDLPERLRSLELRLSYLEGDEYGEPPPDLSPLRKLEHLQWFELSADELPFDLDHLQNCRDLRELILGDAQVWHPERLADFKLLRTLEMRRSRIRDLTPLFDHQHLEVIHADGSRLVRLPKGHLPSLKELHVLGTLLPAAELARFRAANPQCTVSRPWDELFAEQFARATRVQVIDGRGPPRPTDKLLFETDDYREVRRLIDGLVFDNVNSGGSCFCGGGYPALVFHSDAGPISRIGLKHECSILYWSGEALGDGALTDESARHLRSWLRRHAVGLGEMIELFDPPEMTSGRRRWVRYEAILPVPVLLSIEKDWDAEILRVFAQAFPDETERAAVYLRLLGVDEGSWSLLYVLDRDLLGVYLPSVIPQALAAAVSKYPEDEQVLRGAGRWFLGEEKVLALDQKLRNKLLVLVAPHTVRSPRVINRQRAMTTLAKAGGDAAKTVLSEVAAGKFEPRPLPEEDTREDEDRRVPWVKEHPEQSMWDTEFAQELLDRMGE